MHLSCLWPLKDSVSNFLDSISKIIADIYSLVGDIVATVSELKRQVCVKKSEELSLSATDFVDISLQLWNTRKAAQQLTGLVSLWHRFTCLS